MPRLLCLAILQLPSSDTWNGYSLCMDIGVTGGSHQWYCYSYICMAVAAALQMGLFSEASSKDLTEPEALHRRRIYSVLNIMDTYVTTALGLPRTLRDSERLLGDRIGGGFVGIGSTRVVDERSAGKQLAILYMANDGQGFRGSHGYCEQRFLGTD